MNILESVRQWFVLARPEPTQKNFQSQLGCHLEEVVEMVEQLGTSDSEGKYLINRAHEVLCELSEAIKAHEFPITVANNKLFADSLADQIVTATGTGYCANIDVPHAVEIVNNSNYSKFGDDGQPITDGNGKVMKGPNYFKPVLDPLVQNVPSWVNKE